MAEKPYISQSELKDWLRCKRLWYWKHLKRVRLKPEHCSRAIKMGCLIDTVMEIKHKSTNRSAFDDTIETYQIEPFEIAKVRAISKAYKDFIVPRLGCACQHETLLPVYVNSKIGEFNIKGIYDRLYTDHFVETKFTSKPEMYLDVFNIQTQVGTYFLLNEDLEYVIMEVILQPSLQPKKANKSNPVDETPEAYKERCYSDIISRPSHYFKGFDRKTQSFGKKFYRTEFDLKAIKDRYVAVIQEIYQDKQTMESCYQSDGHCFMYNSWCEFLLVCKGHGIPEEMFDIPEGFEL